MRVQNGADFGVQAVKAGVQRRFRGRPELLVHCIAVEITDHEIIGRQFRLFPTRLCYQTMRIIDAKRKISAGRETPLAPAEEAAYFTQCIRFFREIIGRHDSYHITTAGQAVEGKVWFWL